MSLLLRLRRASRRQLALYGVLVACVLYAFRALSAASARNSSNTTPDFGVQHQNSRFFDVDKAFLDRLDKATKRCPNYVEYSSVGHAPYSLGKLELPYMRPPPKCRTFVSPAVEHIIDDLNSKIDDPDLARLVENCLPNTLDTTILWHTASAKLGGLPLSFVVTGDIHAEWLRDAARQLSVYQPFIKYDADLRLMIKGAIFNQANYIVTAPYCNAFHPPPGSGVVPGQGAKDNVSPRPDWGQVFECKYELDSLASFLTLTNEYFIHSGGDLSFLNSLWITAFKRVLTVMSRESIPSFSEDTGRALQYFYAFRRWTDIGTETLPLAGSGNPVNFGTGLIRSAFRPSDDANILQFFIPANMHMVTELKRLKNILTSDVAFDDKEMLLERTSHFIESLSEGVEEHGIVNHPKWGRVYAYEVDGYGSSILMDDANIPSLLSIPDLGYTDLDNEVYQNTRKMILSKEGNPYYLKGRTFEGVGGPHIGIENAWPMSLLMRIRTTDDDDEIMHNLHLVMATTAGLGLMHESIHVSSPRGKSFTRPWFAWCNSEFGKTILHLAKHKPHLIFKKQYAQAYDIDSVLAQWTATRAAT